MLGLIGASLGIAAGSLVGGAPVGGTGEEAGDVGGGGWRVSCWHFNLAILCNLSAYYTMINGCG